MRLSFTLFVLLFTLSLSQNQPDLVVNIFRHGARSPTSGHKIDPTWNSSGELTPVGERQQYILGAALAKTYPNIFNKQFSKSSVYVRSSQSSRCMESVASQLFGAFQNQGSPLPNDYPANLAVPPFDPDTVAEILQGLSNQEAIPSGFVPIIINSVSTEDDTVCETPGTCPALYIDALTSLATKESLDFWTKDLKETKDTLAKLGFKVETPFDFGAISDAWICDLFQNKTLPGNPSSELLLNVTFAGYWYLLLAQYNSDRQKELLSVPIFDQAFQYMDPKANKTSGIEYVAISTHDTALLTVLATLNIVNQTCLMANYKSQLAGGATVYPNCYYPPFAANIIFELYINNSSPYVITKYNDAVIELCGTTQCAYQQFKDIVNTLTKGYTAKDYKNICKNGEIHNLEEIIKEIANIFHHGGMEAVETFAEGSVEKDIRHVEKRVKNIIEDVNDLKDDFEDVIGKIKELVDDVKQKV